MERVARSNKSAGKPKKQVLINNSNVKKKKNQGSSTTSINLPSKIVTYTVPPKEWPANIPYLSSNRVSRTISSLQAALVHPEVLPTASVYSVPTLATFSPSSNPLVQVRNITDPSHPAYPQYGLFAARALAPGTYVMDYTGSLHSCPEPTCSASDYDLAFLDRDASLAIDGALMGNESRFINDYHGIREQGHNAVFEEYFVRIKTSKGKETWEARMGVWVAPSSVAERATGKPQGIAAKEEILVSYGRGWWRARRGIIGDTMNEDDIVEKIQTDNPQDSLLADAVPQDEHAGP